MAKKPEIILQHPSENHDYVFDVFLRQDSDTELMNFYTQRTGKLFSWHAYSVLSSEHFPSEDDNKKEYFPNSKQKQALKMSYQLARWYARNKAKRMRARFVNNIPREKPSELETSLIKRILSSIFQS